MKHCFETKDFWIGLGSVHQVWEEVLQKKEFFVGRDAGMSVEIGRSICEKEIRKEKEEVTKIWTADTGTSLPQSGELSTSNRIHLEKSYLKRNLRMKQDLEDCG